MTRLEKMKKRGIIPKVVVCTVSSDNQRGTIEAQLRAMHDYRQRNSIYIIHEYCDRAKALPPDDRPEFHRG